MSGLLEEAGFKLVDEMDDSDLVLINTCFVKTPTEQKILDRIRGIVRGHPAKKLIIAGCMPEVMSRELSSIAPEAGMVSTHNITRIVEAVERVTKGEKVIFAGEGDEKKLCRPRARKNRFIGITEVSQGCNGNCAYCCVRLAKGPLHCYSPGDIVKDAENAVRDGCREIWLTSQDNGAYFCDGTRLPGLIGAVSGIEGDWRVRIGMMDPDSVLGILGDLVKAYRHEKVYKFLHLPLQSGSDRILNMMNREYNVFDFEKIVSEFRKSIPSITLSTDVIVGFPGETTGDFKETVRIIEKIRPDIVNVSKFGARPGTLAAKMHPVDNKTIKERSVELSEIVRKIALDKNKGWINWQGEILVTETGRRKDQYIGRNFAYKPVLVESKRNMLGETLKVAIKKAAITHLYGVIR
jgi:MiaB-like tRNA modifying enzyme